MPRTTSVTIGAQLDEFVGKLIQSGRYGSASEVMRSALRLLERQENEDVALRSAIEEGERTEKGNTTLRDIAAQIKQKRHV
jgi:antitoxin ParD1/3/4